MRLKARREIGGGPILVNQRRCRPVPHRADVGCGPTARGSRQARDLAHVFVRFQRVYGIANQTRLSECPPPVGPGATGNRSDEDRMTAFFTRLALLALIATMAAPAFAQTDPVVAKVNGTEIRQSDLTAAEED